MDPVLQLRTSLLPVLEGWERELKREHPDLTINICDTSVGSRTDWNGHIIGLDCILKDAGADCLTT